MPVGFILAILERGEKPVAMRMRRGFDGPGGLDINARCQTENRRSFFQGCVRACRRLLLAIVLFVRLRKEWVEALLAVESAINMAMHAAEPEQMNMFMETKRRVHSRASPQSSEASWITGASPA